ncbi:MAG: glutathione S-transferase [Lysobacterales bacterium]|nr:MAG: glutathione S-transferase [Xanthomonadales bacterium]
MAKYKLTYFDFDGGRGEPIRIALHAAGIAFEDNRLTFAQFSEMRHGTRFNSLPVLEIDGAAVTQSNALCRYVGKLAGLYPADALQALYCDEVLDAQEDLSQRIGPTFGLKGEELRQAREKLVQGWMSIYLRGLEQLLVRGGGKYFANDGLTVADLKTFVQTRWLRSGTLDHVPADLVQNLAPGLAEHQERVASDPRVLAYYASRR